MNLVKCDVCGKYHDEGELETVTVVIRKHKDCDVNVLFGQSERKAALPMRLGPDTGRAVVGGVEMPDHTLSREEKITKFRNESSQSQQEETNIMLGHPNHEMR